MCIQALEISDPQLMQLQELIEKYANAHICEMIVAKLSTATLSPSVSTTLPSDADTQCPIIKPSDCSKGNNHLMQFVNAF